MSYQYMETKNSRIAYRAGVRDWLVQRTSAVLLLIYIVILAVLIAKQPQLNFLTWQQIFVPTWFKIASLVAMLSVCLHAWVGIWTIFTDYVNCSKVRFLLMFASVIALLAYFVWFIQILWGVK